MANDLDRLLGVYSQPVRSWPGEEALDEEALANYAAMNPAAPAKLRPDETFRGTFLPFRETVAGTHEWAVPGFLQDVWDAAKTVRDTSGTGLGGMIRPSQYPQDQFDQIIGHGMAGAMTGITGGLARTAIRPPAGTMDLGMFGGRRGAEALAAKGETRPLQALDMLEQMEKAGKSRDEIWAATNEILKDSPYAGAFRGVDKMPRFEIDDSGSRMGPVGATLADTLAHDPLFAAYPEMAGIETRAGTSMGKAHYSRGHPDDGIPPEIVMGDRAKRDTLLHEAQHGVQDIERLASGGNDYMTAFSTPEGVAMYTERIKRMRTPVTIDEYVRSAGFDNAEQAAGSYADYLKQHKRDFKKGVPPHLDRIAQESVAKDYYRALAGETEARTVQKRQDLSPEERRSRPPWEDYDIPESQQIVRFGDKGPQMAASEPFKLERRPMDPVKLHEIGDATYSTPYVVERKVSNVPISDLVGSAHTPDKVAPLAEAIRNNQWIEPLVIDREGNVIEGQHRLRALQQLGFSKVPVHRIRELIPHDAAMRIEKAAQGAGIHSQQARQIAKQVAEIIDAEGAGELRYYEPPRGFENAWRAAVKEATSAEVDKMLSAYSPRKARDDVQMSASDPTLPLPMDEPSRLARAREEPAPIKQMSASDLVTLYHGTTPEGFSAIQSSGRIDGPAFFTPRRDVAEGYGPHVVEVQVPKDALMVDFDLPGAKLLDVEGANGYWDRPGWTIDDWLRSGHSVGVNNPVPLRPDASNLLASHRIPLPLSREDDTARAVDDILRLYGID